MMIGTWSPQRVHASAAPEEMQVAFDRGRAARVLVVPALFDEANKLRRFTLGVMRALDEAGIDSALPDLLGCNESLAPPGQQTIEQWRADSVQSAVQFAATHVLSIRAGALLAPANLPGWSYAPVDGARALSAMLRAQVIAAREAGRNETREDLIARGLREGIMLGGWELGPQLVQQLQTATVTADAAHRPIAQSDIGGAGLWLRAEPGEDAAQSAALARIIAHSIAPSTGPGA